MVRRANMGAGVFVSHAITRHGPICRSHDVKLTKFADERARFQLDHAAQLDLHPVIGDKLQCDFSWPDGEFSTAVEVYAVHPGGLVDVRGISPIHELDQPQRSRLRRYAEALTR